MTEAQLQDWLTTRVAQAAGVEVAAVDVNLPFRDQGVDSATAAQIAGELADVLEVPLDTTVLFEHPSISQLVAALCRDAEQLEVSERSRRRSEPHEPIAVVGLACRMPGAPSVEAFWKLLEDGHDAIGPPPAGRWPQEPELEGIARGGFLAEISGFDLGYFRIPVEEALRMDPQQRLLLEVAVECFEDAGVSDDDLRGSAAGVFVGISSNEYGYRQGDDTRALSALTPTGNALSIAANRLSYVFDLRGLSIALDTACSSSLVALHLACRSLRAGECDVALVAGVNLLLDPQTSIALAKAGFLAPDGLCKTFDASADGYVRAEGCGAALLKPLSQARADGDRVYALVAGSAVNQDGRTNGLTAPNPTAQEQVLRAAYRDAQIDPSTATYVECHGTGTFLGDPIELRALSRVLCGAERERRLLVGSVKTNVGHLEAAAGMAGFIKTSLAIHAGSIPASLNFETPNPNVDIDGLGVQVVTERTRWPEPELVAGVSSFGFGGTNAHVVMTTPQEHPQRAGAGHTQPLLLPVSAKSAAAFTDVARAFADHTSQLTPDELACFAASAALRRNHYAVRDAVVGSTPAELASRLGALTASAADDARPSRGPRVAFVFSGHGSQLGAARGLLAQRLFRGVIERCDEVLGGREPSIRSLILDDGLAPRLDDTALAQPVIVAIQVALVEMLSAVGVVPAAVVGHSVGEISAAYAARALTLDEAIGLAARRGSAMAPTAGRGRMLAVGVDEATARDMIAGKERDVAVAAVNGPAATVLSGRVGALSEVEREAKSRALFAQWLPIDYPFHSSEMEAAATEIADERPRDASGEVAFYSTVVGGRGERALAEPGYWARNVRQPVRLADAVRVMIDDGIDILLEIGPTPVLQTPLRQIAQDRDGVLCACVHTAGRTDESGFLEGLAALYRSGVDLDWSRLWSERQQFVPFPKYRWQHTSLLLERGSMRRRPSKREHALLGARIDVAGPSLVLENEITSDDPGFLADHRVSGMVVFPASGYVELIVTVARYAGLTGALAVDDLDISSLLVLGSDPVRLQTIAAPDGSDAYRVEVYSRPSNEDDSQWVLRAAARAHTYAGSTREVDVADLQRRCLEQIPKPTFYGALADAGLHYGPAFRQLEQIWRTDGEAFAHVPSADPAFSIDPRLLDAAFQLVAAAADVEAAPDGDLWVPIGLERLVVADPPPAGDILVHAMSSRGTDSCDVEVLGLHGEPFAVVSGLRLRRVLARGARTDDHARAWTYDVGWLETEDRIGPDFDDETVVLVGTTLRSRLAAALDGAGARVEALSAGVVPMSEDGQFCATDSYRSRLREVRDGGHRIRRLVYVAPRHENAGPGRAVDLCQDLVALIQAVSFSDGEALPELWIVTSGAHVVQSGGSDGADPFAAAVWGVAKVVPFENPALSVRCVDIDGAEASLTALVGEMLAPSEDAEIAIRNGKRYVRRILPGDAERLASAPEITADGMYVVTGGTGGIGPHLLAWLVRRGARHVAVLSRGGLPDDRRADALRAEPSATLLDVRCDVSVRAEVESALVEIRSHGLPICGVVHAAGVLADGALLSLSSAAIAEPLAPKVAGAWWLAELTADDPVEWYVFFSSAAAVLGSPGQANYAAANACLDALASSMCVRGRRAVSIEWGPWAVGMAAGSNRTGSSLSMSPLDASDAIASLELAISAQNSNALVLPFDLRDLLQFFPPGLGFTLFDKVQTADMARLRNVGRQAGPVPRPALATEYVAPRSEVEERIAQLWQLSLGIERIGVFDGFFELGGDSVFANQMVIEINQSLGVKIDANRAFEEFTVAHIAALSEESLVGRLAAMTDEEAEALLAGSERPGRR